MTKERFKNITVRLFIALLLGAYTPVFAQAVLIDPAIKYQEVEGWGGSLCWWANIMGGYSDTDVLKICDWITDPDGLNMNIFRFNIGGGDDPAHNHMRGDGGAMPGYKASLNDPYDWTQDANQRKVLQQLIASRIAQTGKDDIILEAFSNSPPYWMTNSGCSAGSVAGNVANLRSDMYDDFADYLTEVVKYYHDELGITFQYLEPFNEPFSTWWKAFGGQEGCYFGQAEQEKMIPELYMKLQEKDMLSYCTITAMDANSLDECFNGITGYKSTGGILQKLTKINGHSYFGSSNSRKNLASFCHENDMKLWQSETGPLNMNGSQEELILAMGARIIKDMKEMKCPAWIDWQLAADDSPQWGILVGKYSDPTNPVTKGYGYYIRSQFSRFIKTGYAIIDVKDPNTLAALSPDESELVIVVCNETDADMDHSFDLGAFQLAGQAQRFRTRIVNSSYTEKVNKTNLDLSEDLLEYAAPAFSVTTFVVPVEIALTRIKEGRYYIRNKACMQYVGINNASINLGARLAISGDTPGENSAFDLTIDDLNGGFLMKPGHLGPGSDYVLDVEGTSGADRAKIMQYSDWGGENQRFHFVHLEEDYYKIIIRRSLKCWSLPDDDFDLGALVMQMPWDEADHSIWEIRSYPATSPNVEKAKDLVVNYYAGILNVSSPEDKILTDVFVLNMLGKILKHDSDIYASKHSIALNIDPGMYLLKAMSTDGLTASNIFLTN